MFLKNYIFRQRSFDEALEGRLRQGHTWVDLQRSYPLEADPPTRDEIHDYFQLADPSISRGSRYLDWGNKEVQDRVCINARATVRIAAAIGRIIILRLKSDLDLAAEGGRGGLATTTKVRNRHNSKSCAQNTSQLRRISEFAPLYGGNTQNS